MSGPQFERDIIHERTRAGLEAARSRGRLGGRPKSLPPQRAQALKKLYESKSMPVSQICSMFHIGRTTLYRYVNTEQQEKARRSTGNEQPV